MSNDRIWTLSELAAEFDPSRFSYNTETAAYRNRNLYDAATATIKALTVKIHQLQDAAMRVQVDEVLFPSNAKAMKALRDIAGMLWEDCAWTPESVVHEVRKMKIELTNLHSLVAAHGWQTGLLQPDLGKSASEPSPQKEEMSKQLLSSQAVKESVSEEQDDKTSIKHKVSETLARARQNITGPLNSIWTNAFPTKQADDKRHYEMAVAIDKICTALHPEAGAWTYDKIAEEAIAAIKLADEHICNRVAEQPHKHVYDSDIHYHTAIRGGAGADPYAVYILRCACGKARVLNGPPQEKLNW